MQEWYKESFGEDYLLVYQHRDVRGAYNEVKKMMDWLHLEKGASILDLCCGTGRHSIALHEFGYQVTGVDLSEVLLREAVKSDREHQIRWLKGDMRNVPLEESFDAVVNLFTSFGYFTDDQENRRVLMEMERLLKPGAKFIIDYLNPDYVKANLVPFSERRAGNVMISERRSINKEDGTVEKKITVTPMEDGQKKREYLESVKLYGLQDFERLLQGTALTIDQVYGGYDQEEYHPATSHRLILLGHKGETVS